MRGFRIAAVATALLVGGLAANAEDASAEDASAEDASAEDANPAAPADAEILQAFRAMTGEWCNTASVPEGEAAVSRYAFAYREPWQAPDEPENRITVFRVFCVFGAYNALHYFYTWKPDEGLRPLQFAVPALDLRYRTSGAVPDPDDQAVVEHLGIKGFTTTASLTNSNVDPAAGTISEHALWRGMGDAFSDALWTFRDGQFVLTRYDVDAAYDGAENPQRLVGGP